MLFTSALTAFRFHRFCRRLQFDFISCSPPTYSKRQQVICHESLKIVDDRTVSLKQTVSK